MKCVILLSGGLDSTVLLAHLIADGHENRAVSVLYGQRHRREVESAADVSHLLRVPHEVVELPPSIMAGTTLTGGSKVPHGHYAHESMRKTVVPNRNMVLLAVAGSVAVREGCEAVAYAAHAGDHFIYPDCRPEFGEAMSSALALCDEKPVRLLRPFVNWTKSDVVRRGAELGVPFVNTWSCYEGGSIHCGLCGTCFERRESFALAGVPDPTEYAA